MPRDAVTVTELTLDTAADTPAGTAINPTNGASLDVGGSTRGLLLRVTNTAGADKDVTVKAGDNPPAFRSGIGDLTITVPATTGDKVVSLESARFIQDDGTILVDFAASMTGKISAIRVPKEA